MGLSWSCSPLSKCKKNKRRRRNGKQKSVEARSCQSQRSNAIHDSRIKPFGILPIEKCAKRCRRCFHFGLLSRAVLLRGRVHHEKLYSERSSKSVKRRRLIRRSRIKAVRRPKPFHSCGRVCAPKRCNVAALRTDERCPLTVEVRRKSSRNQQVAV